MGQIKAIKLNLTKPRNFDISFCLIFNCYGQSNLWKRDWLLGSALNQRSGFLNIS